MSAIVQSAIDSASRAPEPTTHYRVRSFGLTDRGRVRESNEDQFLVAELTRSLHVHQSSLTQENTREGDDRGHLLVVADGMGGHAGGEHASALAVGSIEDYALNTLRWFFRHDGDGGQAVLLDLQTALRAADQRVIHEAQLHPELRGMGTTLTLAYVLGPTLFVIHVGDSRCYLLRGGLLYQLTTDHTVAQELVREGVLTQEMAVGHHYSHVITNAIGGASEGIRTEFHELAIGPGDVILLCSDGMTDMLSDARIAEVLRTLPEPAEACRRLIDEANAAGGRDNITGIVARIEDPASPLAA